MKRMFCSMMCGVAVASLLGSQNPASAVDPKVSKTTTKTTTTADPKGFKPTISANPTVVMLEATAKTGKATLTYNAGAKHPFVEVWVSVNGADLKKVLEAKGNGKGTHTATIEKGKKYRFVLTDFGKQLAFVDVVTKLKSSGTTPIPGGGTTPKPGGGTTTNPGGGGTTTNPGGGGTTTNPGGGGTTTNPGTNTAAMAKAIVNFAASRVGQKGLGDGQCTRLIEAALAAAGAKPGKGFVWGRTLKAGETMQPGDIIQFTKFVIKDGFATWNLGSPDHTSIVSQVNGNKVTLLHQNMDGPPATEKSRVRSQEFDFSKRDSGSFIVYRPEPK